MLLNFTPTRDAEAEEERTDAEGYFCSTLPADDNVNRRRNRKTANLIIYCEGAD